MTTCIMNTLNGAGGGAVAPHKMPPPTIVLDYVSLPFQLTERVSGHCIAEKRHRPNPQLMYFGVPGV